MNAASPPLSSTLPTSLLWERLRALFGRVIAAIGAPAVIATLMLAPRLRTSIMRQITLVEIMARKLLLADAVQLMPTQRGPRLVEVKLAASGLYTCPPPRRQANRRVGNFDPARPETWDARFSLALPRDQYRPVQDRRAGWNAQPPRETAPRQRQSSAFRAARRAEALRRMLNDPAPYARRLSRARRIGVNRSRDIITRYALRAPRRFVGDRSDPLLTLDVFKVAVNAHGILIDTS